MKKFKARYVVFAIILLILVFNDGNRSLFRRFFERDKLKVNIKNAELERKLLNKRIYNLENEPAYLEKMVRSELNVIDPGEIEYRFSFKDE
jgi:cell division protein FtsB